MSDQYIIIPGTNIKVFEGTVVVLNRLPSLKWILHHGPYYYSGRRQKGWYFSSIPSDTTMPVFNEDLVNMRVVDDPVNPCPPQPGPIPPPFPPGPFPPGPGPIPPVPLPIPFTSDDKKKIDAAFITVDTLEDRDKLSSDILPEGKLLRVNDIDGHGTIEYYSWDDENSCWIEASFGSRYPDREEIDARFDEVNVSIAEVQANLDAVDARVEAVEEKVDFGEGSNGEILVTSDGNIRRSGMFPSDSTLSEDGSPDVLTTEEAVVNALTWAML